jgi:hypothetical protein
MWLVDSRRHLLEYFNGNVRFVLFIYILLLYGTISSKDIGSNGKTINE